MSFDLHQHNLLYFYSSLPGQFQVQSHFTLFTEILGRKDYGTKYLLPKQLTYQIFLLPLQAM